MTIRVSHPHGQRFQPLAPCAGSDPLERPEAEKIKGDLQQLGGLDNAENSDGSDKTNEDLQKTNKWIG